MKNSKLLAVCFVMAVALLTASASYGQQVLLGAGSSGAFGSISIAMVTPDPITGAAALCGSNAWSTGGSTPSSLSVGVDTRGGGIHNEPANLFVAWDNDTAPTKVCGYLAVDSIVGERLFFEQGPTTTGNGYLQIGAAAEYTVGANKVSFVQDNLSCATSTGATSFPIALSLVSGTTLQATVFGGGNFSNYFANGATITVTGSPVAADNVSGVTISGVTQLSPLSFTYSGTAGAASDASGSATVTVTPNCPGLPAAVYNLIAANPHFTMAFSDIRPEDALFQSQRVIAALNPNDPTTTNMGYGNKGILSAYSQGVAYPVNYAITGTDPISGTGIPPYVATAVGAQVLMQIANNTDTSACGLGNAAFTNVSWYALARAYEGLAGATQDLSPALLSSAAGCPKPLWPVEREPLSGTYTTREWQIDRPYANRAGSQENYNVGYPQSNNNPAACAAWVAARPSTLPTNPTFPPAVAPPLYYDSNNCGNPLDIQTANYTTATPTAGPYGGYGGNRTRGITNGEMVSIINSTNTANSLGYGFYSLGTYGGKTRVKYVTLDNADPLWPSYVDNPYGPGNWPACTGKVNLGTFTCPLGQPTFDGLVGGGYRNWNELSAVSYGSAVPTCASPFTALTIGCFIQAAQDQVHTYVKDFVPYLYCANSSCSSQTLAMPFFRSHYAVSGVLPHDGNNPAAPASCHNVVPIEAGGSMAGQIFPVQSDYTLQNNVGCSSELTNFFQ